MLKNAKKYTLTKVKELHDMIKAISKAAVA